LMLLEGLDFDKMKQKKRFILPQNSWKNCAIFWQNETKKTFHFAPK
jgi:hypothetical protein